nr:eukaryotic translation initiation factor 2D [Ipomoea batatas]
MFKKTVEVKSQQRLSGADRKKLRRTIRERFPNASDADFDTLLPPKAEFTVSKYPNRILVYGLEGDCPLFFDIDGRGNEIFPTEDTLIKWKPERLTSSVTKILHIFCFSFAFHLFLLEIIIERIGSIILVEGMAILEEKRDYKGA